jgi:hypothetical protein
MLGNKEKSSPLSTHRGSGTCSGWGTNPRLSSRGDDSVNGGHKAAISTTLPEAACLFSGAPGEPLFISTYDMAMR